MDPQPDRPDDLTDLERRLAACPPSAEGLDADAMLFAAGRASARRGRLVWPALTAGLAVLSVALGAWLFAERAERIELARRLRHQPAAPAPPVIAPQPPAAPEPPPANRPPDSSVLASHKALEHGLDAWPPAAMSGTESQSPEPPPLRVGLLHSLPDL